MSEFKKGQTVVVYTVSFETCNVSTTEYTVRSCGAKRLQMIRTDNGRNAKFEMNAPFRGERRYCDVQCASVDRVAYAAAFRKLCATWTRAHFLDRTATAEQGLRECRSGAEGYAKAIAEARAKFEAATADIIWE